MKYAIDRLKAEVSAKSLGEVEQITERLTELAILRVEQDNLMERRDSLELQLEETRRDAVASKRIDQTEENREHEDTLSRKIADTMTKLEQDRMKLRNFELEYSEKGAVRTTEEIVYLRRRIRQRMNYVDHLENELKEFRESTRDNYSARANRVELGRRMHNLQSKLERVNQAITINQSAIDQINEPELDD